MAAVSSRYARALAEVICKAKLDPTSAVAQLRTLAEAFQASPQLRGVWETPAIPANQKLKVLDALAARAGVTARQLRNFVAVLIDHGRIALLPEIAVQVERELNARGGRIDADIVSARELTQDQKVALLV